MNTKLCRTCCIEKPLTDFHISATNKLGRRKDCMSCRSKMLTIEVRKNMPSERVCKTCKQNKGIDHYMRDVSDWRKNRVCNDCASISYAPSLEKRRISTNKWREKNLNSHRLMIRFTGYKKWGLTITLTEYEELYKKSKGVCAICNTPEEVSYSLHLDHCHSTNKVRGLLCKKCNLGLGYFNDNISSLEEAILYLKRNREYLPTTPNFSSDNYINTEFI